MQSSGHSRHQNKPCRCQKGGARSPEPKLELRRWCKYCKREFNRTCLYEHQRWHCPDNPHRKKRSFTTKKCHHCKKMIHEKKFLPPCQDSFEEEVAVSFHSVVQWFNRSLGVPHGQHVSGCVWMRCVDSQETLWEAAIYVHVHII